jgi:hypothetical protein
MEGLAFALLDTSAAISDAADAADGADTADAADAATAARLRDLTISWTRFKHAGPILEGRDLDGLLARAAASGHRYCLVQAWGHILQEVWTPDSQGGTDFVAALMRWAAERDFAAAGGPDCLLVDLARYHPGSPVTPFPAALASGTARLTADAPLGDLGDLDLSDAARRWGAGTARFLASTKLLTGNLPRGVFVWNIESYDDVSQPADDFTGPLSTLYSVAAGFKPNWILESHGFDERTRVVFYDYSEAGLEFRRLLLEEWDGADYPTFLRHLFRRLPSSRAFYLLWDGATPEDLDWDDVAARWRQEIERWGGESVLRAHWARYRRLRHELVPCNLLEGGEPLLTHLRDERSALIWWSNAFFTIYSNWRLDARQRQEIYSRWIERLARRAPRLLLYGASSNNISVNAVRAAEYWQWYRENAGDELEPGRLHRVELRF